MAGQRKASLAFGIFATAMLVPVLYVLAVWTIPQTGTIVAPSVTKGITSPERMTEVVLKEIPLGTVIDQAQEFIEREGFECTFLNEDIRKGRTILHCDRSDQVEWPVSRRWQVLLTCDSGKVVEVNVHSGLVGP